MYGKQFASMYTGSMMGSGPLAFAVWGWVISHQVPNQGRTEFTVELNPRMVAFQIGKCSEEEVALQVLEFEKPDPESRSKEEEGRKLIRLSPYLYRVVNGAHYDKMKREEDRREYNRTRLKEIRKADRAAQEVNPDTATKKVGQKFRKPAFEELKLIGAKIGLPDEEVTKFFNYYEANGWRVGRNPMKSVVHALANWKMNWQSGKYQKPGNLEVQRRKEDALWDKKLT